MTPLDQRRIALTDVEEGDPQPGRRGKPGGLGARQHRPERQRDHGTEHNGWPCPAHARPRAPQPGTRRPRALRGRWPARRAARRRRARPTSRRPPGSRPARRAARPAPLPICPSATASIASHMAGATAGAASTLAGSDTSDACPKCAAMSGAVPSVAAPVSAVASASPRGRRRRTRPSRTRPARTRIATTAAKLSCQPTSSIARGLRASVTAVASSSACQRAAGRPASTATTPAAPITPARSIDGPLPASGT